MKIGIYGGSFNPVHNGHLATIKKALSGKFVDKVWIVPCKKHAFDKELAPAKDRMNMLELAIEGMKDVRIDDTEIGSSGKSYTSRTLRKFLASYSHEFYFIAGTDLMPTLDEWDDFGFIKTIPFILVKRKIAGKIRRDITIEGIIEKISDISSTDIRERYANHETISGLVPSAVEHYIACHNLYIDKCCYKNPSATATVIVQMENGIPFVKRKHSPFKGYWALPGGHLVASKEDLPHAAARELFEETSLVTDPNDMELLEVNSSPNRDPRGHVIDHIYTVRKYSGTLKANDDAADVRVFRTKPRNLAFDHSKVYDDYIRGKSK